MRLKTLKLVFVLLVVFITSCVKNIDFDQVEDYETETKYVASLVYFKMPVSSFLDSSNNELLVAIEDESRVTIFEEEFIQDYLIEAEFEFEITNPYSRDIQATLEFLDDSDNITYTFNTIVIPANINRFKPQKEVVIIANTPNFLNSRKVKASIQLLTSSGTPIDINNINDFEFKSAGTFTFKI